MANAGIDLDTLLDNALDRQYSGNPAEILFTGGGAHIFANFDNKEDGMIFTLREGLKHSVNLVYVRLMRDLVRFYEARLPYDPDTVMNQTADHNRQRVLKEIADQESEKVLYEATEPIVI